jgi:hypothetical protein
MAAGVRQTKWLPSTGIAIFPPHLQLDAVTRSVYIYTFFSNFDLWCIYIVVEHSCGGTKAASY